MTDTLTQALARVGDSLSEPYLRAHPEAIPESLVFDGEVVYRQTPSRSLRVGEISHDEE